MRKMLIVAASIILLALLETGCAHHHFRPCLMEAQEDGTFDAGDTNNTILVPKDTKVTVKLDAVKLPIVHHKPSYLPAGPKWLPTVFWGWKHVLPGWWVYGKYRQFKRHEGIGGAELWLVVRGNRQNNDALMGEGIVSDSFVFVSNIKRDMASLSFMPLDAKESIPFEREVQDGYELTFTVYEVDADRLKSTLFDATRSNLVEAATATVGIWVTTTKNVLLRGILQIGKNRFSDAVWLERQLITLGADVEFQATLRLLADAAMPKEVLKGGKGYALYDLVRSKYDLDGNGWIDKDKEDDAETDGITEVPGKPKEWINYDKRLRLLEGVTLPSRVDPNAPDDKGQTTLSFIKFTVLARPFPE